MAEKLYAYEIKSFRGGISDYNNKGIDGAFKFGSGLSIRRKADTLSCNQALEAVGGGVITDLINASVPASDGNTYLFGDSGKIYKLSSGVVTLVHTDVNGEINGAGEWMHANDKSYIFWTTSTRLNSKEIPGSSDWSDVNDDIVVNSATYTYPKTDLDPTTWHTMNIGNGALNICNGDKLALVGWDGSYTNESVRFLPRTTTNTIIEYGLNLIVGTGFDGDERKGYLFDWEQSALSYIGKDLVPGSVNSMVKTEILLMQLGDDGGLFFSGSDVELPSVKFPGGGKTNPHAAVNDKGLALFGVYGASDSTMNGIYSYGRQKKNGSFALNLEYPIDCDEIGMIEFIDDELHVSYKKDSTYTLAKYDADNKQVGTFETIEYRSPASYKDGVEWDQIFLSTADMPSGTSIEVYYKIDKKATWTQAKMPGDIAQFTAGNKAYFNVAGRGKRLEIKVVLTPNGNDCPEVYEILVGFRG